MSLERLLTRSSVIVTVTQSDTDVDEYGNPTTDELSAAELCYFERFVADEQNLDRATTSDDWLYIVRAGAALTSIDHVEVDGEDGTFEVVGEPAHVWNPRRRAVSHIEARLRRTTR